MINKIKILRLEIIILYKKIILDIKNSSKRILYLIRTLLLISTILLISTFYLSIKVSNSESSEHNITHIQNAENTSVKTTIADYGFNNMMNMTELIQIKEYDFSKGTITIDPFGGAHASRLNDILAEYITDLRYQILVFEDSYYYNNGISYYGIRENYKADPEEYYIIDNKTISNGYSVKIIETDYNIEKNYLVVKFFSGDAYYVPIDLIDWQSADYDYDTECVTYKLKNNLGNIGDGSAY